MINSSARQDKERKIVLAQTLCSLSCLAELFIEKKPGYFNYSGI